jgi:UDP:flavonoid glycosyltransferase YjiC (YdhE family)
VEEWRSDWTTRRRRHAVYRCTGPLFAQLDLPVPPDVDEFLARHSPVVLVSLSSSTPELIRRVVASTRAAGAAVLVAATLHDLPDLQADDVCVAGILPNHVVMPRVDACVVMGGQGSVQTALASGAPSVVLPLHPEQELNAAVAERVGAAIRMSPATAGTPQLVNAIRSLLDDPAYDAAAGRVASLYARVDGASEAAEAMLAFTAERSRA